MTPSSMSQNDPMQPIRSYYLVNSDLQNDKDIPSQIESIANQTPIPQNLWYLSPTSVHDTSHLLPYKEPRGSRRNAQMQTFSLGRPYKGTNGESQ